jgi:hypothetical protein
MARPIYKRDENSELAVGEIIARWTGARLVKTEDQFCLYDFKAFRGDKLVGIVEVKSRSHGIGQYPTLMLSQQKVDALLEAGASLGVPVILVVNFAGKVAVMKLRDAKLGVPRVGGRIDRADPGDIEAVYHLQMSQFKPLPDAAYEIGPRP